MTLYWLAWLHLVTLYGELLIVVPKEQCLPTFNSYVASGLGRVTGFHSRNTSQQDVSGSLMSTCPLRLSSCRARPGTLAVMLWGSTISHPTVYLWTFLLCPRGQPVQLTKWASEQKVDALYEADQKDSVSYLLVHTFLLTSASNSPLLGSLLGSACPSCISPHSLSQHRKVQFTLCGSAIF